jgi:hypothetical protein
MPHHYELTMSDETAPHPQLKITWLIGLAAALAIFSLIGGYSARMTRNTAGYEQDRAAQRYQNLATVQAAESKQLNPVDDSGKPTAIWIDEGKGVISIPIEEAMAKEVDDLKAKTCGPGPEINPAPVAAAPAPAPAATNAAPVLPVQPAGKPAAPGAKPATGGAPTAPPAKPKT